MELEQRLRLLPPAAKTGEAESSWGSWPAGAARRRGSLVPGRVAHVLRTYGPDGRDSRVAWEVHALAAVTGEPSVAGRRASLPSVTTLRTICSHACYHAFAWSSFRSG
jgi:hypothetical protein